MTLIRAERPGWAVRPAYGWLVFALTFALLLSDYMSRQVLVAVFPALKHDWRLTDAQLGGLVGVVALMVGLLTVPLSVAADRYGRVRSIVVMALLWSGATAACGFAATYGQMFLARICIGIGEAAYGSVGVAVLFAIFPASMRGTVTGAFMAGGVFGSVIGLGVGGPVTAHLGWRWAFLVMAVVGAVLALAYGLTVSESRLGAARPIQRRAPRPEAGEAARALARGLFPGPVAVFAYLGSGLQLSVSAAMVAWLPSHLHRAYGMDISRAAGLGALFLLVSALGMVLCGWAADRIGRARSAAKPQLAAAYCLASGLVLAAAFVLPAGPLQLALLAFGLLVSGGAAGPAGAIVGDVTSVRMHGGAMAVLTLSNNLLGLAPGPVLTGVLADHLGLEAALRIIPLIGLVSGGAFLLCASRYGAAEPPVVGPPASLQT